ncbi:carboxypeptidase C (cathepsin A) [Paraburkholderia youngii]
MTGPNDVTLGENPQTLIDKTDMVFVDPPGTGYSEAIAPKKNQDFWGVDADETVNAGLIYRYISGDRSRLLTLRYQPEFRAIARSLLRVGGSG